MHKDTKNQSYVGLSGQTLTTNVCWQLSSVPHPLDLNSCTFNSRAIQPFVHVCQTLLILILVLMMSK